MVERTMYQRLILFSVALLAVFFGGCGYNDFGELQLPDNEDIQRNMEISTLRDWHRRDGVQYINDDFVIAGWVTAEDKSDNFHRTFMLQDFTGAIEIRAGIYDLNTVFPRDRLITIKTKNLALSMYNGVLQLGRPPLGNDRQVDYIVSHYVRGTYFWPQDDYRTMRPRNRSSVDGLTDDLCGRLVRIDDIQYVDTEHVTWAGMRIFVDACGHEIAVNTSTYADFADDNVPLTKVALTGILSKNSTRYILKLRDINDVEIR